MPQADRGRIRNESAAALLIYSTLTLSLLRRLFGHLTDSYIGQSENGRGADPASFMWCLRWWRYALEHRINPFLTDLLWAPRGFNLAWSNLVPLPAWIGMPLGSWIGEAAEYNILCVAAIVAASLSAFMLCRRVSGAFWPALLGGALFGFSPFMLQQSLAHLHMVMVFPIPLMVIATMRRLGGEISARRFAAELAALLCIQFLCAMELFALDTVFGSIALALLFAASDSSARRNILGLAVPIVLAYGATLAILSPYLFYLFKLGSPGTPGFEPSQYSADLLNFIVPSDVNQIGRLHFATAIMDRSLIPFSERTAYLGPALIVIFELYRRSFWNTAGGRTIALMAAILAIASLGPVLHVANRTIVPMPWALVDWMPLLSNSLPARFSLYLSLVIAIGTAIWLAGDFAEPAAKLGIAAAVIMFSLPNLSASFWVSPLDIPRLFTDGDYSRDLKPGEIVLPLPFGPRSNCLYWQARTGMYFRMSAGWVGFAPFEFERMPVRAFAYGAIDLPEAADQFKAYVARFGVTAIVADTSNKFWNGWRAALAPIGEPELSGGAALYRFTPGQFSAYANLSGAALEARAAALRFDTALEASARYLADGGDPAALSAAALEDAKLLPNGWEIDRAPVSYLDWQAAPFAGGKIGLIVSGTYDALMPLIDRYRNRAAVFFPAPRPWTPSFTPNRYESYKLLLVFDRAALTAAAAELKSSPPPERTTSFIAGVAAWRPAD